MSDVDQSLVDIVEYFGEDPLDISRVVAPVRDCVGESDVFPYFVRHPLVHGPFFSWKLTNRAYEVKTDAIRRALRDRNWRSLVWTYERPYRLGVVDWLIRRKSDEDFRELFLDVWQDTELPVDNFPDSIDLFRLMSASETLTDDPAGWASVPPRVTLYRGLRDGTGYDGLSWTADRATAIFFARRFSIEDDRPALCTYVADKSEILAWITGRGEQEAILDFDDRSDRSRIIMEWVDDE